ncbi:flagellin [Vannielia sp.]|uniref:flagellin n=1 Tax=Vannielia sp. TaxID=2813045 RepID=UPI00260950D1|nr:flagellin [Vannielia sp.]MDF1872351.1 flagellin [Vannielia sp.]
MLNQISHGDMARLFLMNNASGDAKTAVTQLAQELATGHKASLADAVNGDFSPISSIEFTLSRNAAYETAATEANTFAAVIQNAFDTVATLSENSATAMLTAAQAVQPENIGTAAADAASKLAPTIAAFNTQFAGRSVFAGQAVDGPALADAETIMAALTTATAADTDAASIIASLEAWFAPGGDFDTVAYIGSTDELEPMEIGNNVTADLSITASDTRIRDTLKGLALASLIADGALSPDSTARAELLSAAGEITLNANTSLTHLRAEIGTVQALMEDTDTFRTAETTALEIARAELVEIDPYDTATQLQAAQSQLEMLYSITARMQSLSLVNYL